MLASQTDETLLVTRLRGLKVESLEELRQMFDRLPKDPIGVVVIGGTATASPYLEAPPSVVGGSRSVAAVSSN